MDNQNQPTPSPLQNPAPLSNPLPPVNTDPKAQIADRLKKANNVLVTVSNNPSVDQLAACIGLTLILNKMDKHATAVFSGNVPSTIEFLQPEETLEKTTDSLRDFIISLDKSKADKLRYKVEDRVVKIFITPYRTSINEKDLEFSQGDFNVDIVVALGVHEQKDLDQAITAHGRILHDAVVTTVSTTTPSTLGMINWQDTRASSLSELVTSLSDSLGQNLLDGQIATALLTGIVAETDRFSNDKTSPRTMSASAALMSAGANQQLVATKLQPVSPPAAPQDSSAPKPPAAPPEPPKDTLEIAHDEDNQADAPTDSLAEAAEELRKQQQIHIDEEGKLHRLTEDHQQSSPGSVPTDIETTQLDSPSNPRVTIQTPPTFNGTLTAESKPEPEDPTSDAMSMPNSNQPILSHGDFSAAPGLPTPPPPPEPSSPPPSISLPPVSPPSQVVPDEHETLGEIEQSVDSPHMRQADTSFSQDVASPQLSSSEPPDLDSLRSVVDEAASSSAPLPTPEAFNSQMLDDNINTEGMPPPVESVPPAPTGLPDATQTPLAPYIPETAPGPMPSDQPPTMQLPQSFPPSLVPPAPSSPQPFTDSPTDSPTAPPPVPPPFQFGPPPDNPQ